MLTRWRLNMADLPSYDRARAFRPLVALFAIADTRRRERHRFGVPGVRGRIAVSGSRRDRGVVDRDVDRRAAAAVPADAPGVRKLSTHRAAHRIGAGQQRVQRRRDFQREGFSHPPWPRRSGTRRPSRRVCVAM
ncbi:hypothetical protein [Streptomyces mirabilis]|uniref:hypothetical protein n=1 Tax=Streptomyces mirabilis TaxID=68239 RepID=UPI0033297338